MPCNTLSAPGNAPVPGGTGPSESHSVNAPEDTASPQRSMSIARSRDTRRSVLAAIPGTLTGRG